MVGIIQKMLLDLVEATGGVDAVEEVKRRSGVPLDRTFRLDTAYSDDEWGRMLGSAEAVLGLSRPALIDAFAEHFYRDSLDRWPTWWKMSHSAREMFERQPVIHNCFATALGDPAHRREVRDKFALECHPSELVTHYRSANHLCDLYVALARRVLRHYGENATISQTRCTHLGDAECEIHIVWDQPAALAS